MNNKRSKEDNCVQIVKKLIEKYHYAGVHNSYYISEFIQNYRDADSSEDKFERLIAQILLADLTQNPEQYCLLSMKMNFDTLLMKMDKNDYVFKTISQM